MQDAHHTRCLFNEIFLGFAVVLPVQNRDVGIRAPLLNDGYFFLANLDQFKIHSF
jgi:hypothetical protein